VDAMAELLTDRPAYESMARRANPYGDGCAATRAVSFLKEWWDRTSGSRPIAAGSNVDTAVTFDA
jgi:UDP-N-acetylglucosamine 2-epimerase